MRSDLPDLNCICQLNKPHHKDNPGEHAFDDCPEFKGVSTVSCLLQLICITAGADLQSVPPVYCVSSVCAAVHVVARHASLANARAKAGTGPNLSINHAVAES